MFAYEYDDIKPDMMILGKSLSGGFYPVSAVLGKSEVLDQIKPGEMGITIYKSKNIRINLWRKSISMCFE